MTLIIQALLLFTSRLPFTILHRFSDVLFLFVFYGLKYRRKVVQENLKRSFPGKSEHELNKIEKEFYRSFCDLVFETIKTTTISKEELLNRCRLVTPNIMREMTACEQNIVGISSHLGNWEWLSVSVSILYGHKVFGVYTPLTNKKLDTWIKKTRERFGLSMITAKQLKEALNTEGRFLIGLLADQAPSQFAKAIEIPLFLNQKTYFSPGPGVFVSKYGMKPVWAWAKRVGRSRYEWGLEWMPELERIPELETNNSLATEQTSRVAEAHSVDLLQAHQAINIVNRYSQLLEERIQVRPQDWLWSHRRWKLRSR